MYLTTKNVDKILKTVAIYRSNSFTTLLYQIFKNDVLGCIYFISERWESLNLNDPFWYFGGNSKIMKEYKCLQTCSEVDFLYQHLNNKKIGISDDTN